MVDTLKHQLYVEQHNLSAVFHSVENVYVVSFKEVSLEFEPIILAVAHLLTSFCRIVCGLNLEIGSDFCNLSVFSYPDAPVYINGNAEMLSKTFMSLLSNAVYAMVKKAQRMQYDPEIDVTVTTDSQQVMIRIRDNGIGIENTIIDKIFDPFFTTKTTSEASGVGLYLSRETIQNYGGDITVKSQKDTYTEFSIILPTTKP